MLFVFIILIRPAGLFGRTFCKMYAKEQTTLGRGGEKGY